MIPNCNLNLLLKPVYIGFDVRKAGGLKRLADPILIFDKMVDISR